MIIPKGQWEEYSVSSNGRKKRMLPTWNLTEIGKIMGS
jgi:hypothetical protein